LAHILVLIIIITTTTTIIIIVIINSPKVGQNSDVQKLSSIIKVCKIEKSVG